jgi:hypothetical protein
LVPADEPLYAVGTVFRHQNPKDMSEFARVTLGTYALKKDGRELKRFIEYVEVSANHGAIMRVPESEFAAMHSRWNVATNDTTPHDHPSRQEVGY